MKKDGRQHSINGELELADDGQLALRGHGPSALTQMLGGTFDVTLTTSDGWTVVCEGCWLRNVTSSSRAGLCFEAQPGMVTATTGGDPDEDGAVACAVFVGGDQRIGGDTFDHLGSRTVIDLSVVRQASFLYGSAVCGFEREVGYCYLDHSPTDPDVDRSVLDRLVMFLSFAYSRFICCPWYIRFDNRGAIRLVLKPAGEAGTSGSTLYVSYPQQVSNLILQGWSRWDSVGGGLDLMQLINHYALVRQQSFVEARVMLACIWMEAFKHQYGASIRKYAVDKGGSFLKPGTTNRYALRELVEEGMQHFGIANPYVGFVPTRNEVVHSGAISAPMSDKIEMDLQLVAAIEQFFFTVFDFQGLIWDRVADKWRPWKG